MSSQQGTYSEPVRLSILAWLLILITPVLIWTHPLIDARLAIVPAVVGLRLLQITRRGNGDTGLSGRRLRPA